MSAHWTPQFIFALGVSLAMGNVLAIGAHVFSWWLRKRARLLIVILGALVLLLFLGGIGFLCSVDAQGGFNLFGESSPPPADWPVKAVLSFVKVALISGGVISLFGFVQMRHIPARWDLACLCFCFEASCAILLWQVGNRFFHTSQWQTLGYSYSQNNSLRSAFGVAFGLSFFVLALFRPLFLVVLKYIHSCFSSISSDAEQFS